MEDNRLISTGFRVEDADTDRSLRPTTLADYFGQQRVKDSLSVYMQAAIARREPLDHISLYGPPGLGKTTLAVHHRCGNGAQHTRHQRPGD